MHVQDAVILLSKLDRMTTPTVSVEVDCQLPSKATELYPKGYVLDKEGNPLFKIVDRLEYISLLKRQHNLMRKSDALRGNSKRV